MKKMRCPQGVSRIPLRSIRATESFLTALRCRRTKRSGSFFVPITGPSINLLVFLFFLLYKYCPFLFGDRPDFSEATKPNISSAPIQRIFLPGNPGYLF
jgi:hypothetical protein